MLHAMSGCNRLFQDARDGGFFFTFNLWQDWRELHFLARQFFRL
jgi:hypothetical protein